MSHVIWLYYFQINFSGYIIGNYGIRRTWILQFPEKLKEKNDLNSPETGRVIAEHKERYIVRSAKGEFEAEISGNMRFAAKNREDFPAVGDWVSLTNYESGIAIIHEIFPRFSLIKRQAVGKPGEIQIIAANIDYAFIIQSIDRDFNINRLERYLTICNSSKIRPIIVLTKIDLIDETRLAELIGKIKTRERDVPLLAISNETHDGFEAIIKSIEKGKTYCLLGSSGVGKSTLLNNLAGRDLMRTESISQTINRGKHVTSHRQLIILDNGGILIDNPGMREVGIADATGGLEATFERIVALAQNCRFSNCTHISEKGCSVLEAVEQEEIDKSSYENFLKMEREKAYYEETLAERRKKEKDFGKFVKNYKKEMKRKKE